MDVFIHIIGKGGMIAIIGIAAFLYIYKYSIQLFDLVERNTMGTRTYIMEKLDFLFIDVAEEKITYLLLGLSFGPAILVIAIGLIAGKLIQACIFATILFVVGWKIPKPFINWMVEQRIKKYQSQMVDALTLLANGIRAGLSVQQSLGMVVGEMPAPISQEFNVILQQNKIGVPLEECFENLAKRVPIEDNDMFVTSINILKETGGNLAEVFDTIVEVIRERVRLQQKIDTLTAQGKFQGYIIASMPFMLLLMFAASDPSILDTLFGTLPGNALLVFVLALDVIGLIIIMKIVKIKN